MPNNSNFSAEFALFLSVFSDRTSCRVKIISNIVQLRVYTAQIQTVWYSWGFPSCPWLKRCCCYSFPAAYDPARIGRCSLGSCNIQRQGSTRSDENIACTLMLRYVIPCEWILCWAFPNSSIRSLSEAFACQAQPEHVQFAPCLLRGAIALCGKWVGPNWRDCLLTSAFVSAAQWSAIANSYLRGNRFPKLGETKWCGWK